jgi:hypothetical protein
MQKIMKQHPNMLDMLKIYWKKWKQQKESEFQRLTQNRPVYDELSLNLEPKLNDIQLSYNFRYSAISDQLDRIYKVWPICDKIWYTDAKTLWIRPD